MTARTIRTFTRGMLDTSYSPASSRGWPRSVPTWAIGAATLETSESQIELEENGQLCTECPTTPEQVGHILKQALLKAAVVVPTGYGEARVPAPHDNCILREISTPEHRNSKLLWTYGHPSPAESSKPLDFG